MLEEFKSHFSEEELQEELRELSLGEDTGSSIHQLKVVMAKLLEPDHNINKVKEMKKMLKFLSLPMPSMIRNK